MTDAELSISDATLIARLLAEETDLIAERDKYRKYLLATRKGE